MDLKTNGWESQKETDHWEDLEVCRWLILKWILEGWSGIEYIDLAQYMYQ
jgi:hypothetical protein